MLKKQTPALSRALKHYARFRLFYHFLIYIVLALTVSLAVGFNLPLASLLGVYIPLALLGIFPIVQFIRLIHAVCRVAAFNKKIEQDEMNAVNNCGVCGTGKTFEAVYENAKKAESNWIELQFDYWENCLADDGEGLSGQKLEDYRTIKESYEFTKNSKGIPLLHSNIPIRRISDGKFAHKLYREHLEQERRLPLYAVGITDEFNTVVSNEETRSKAPLNISELFRWSRQFLLLKLASTEQNMMRINKEVRNVVEENREFSRSKNILKPLFLSWLYKRLKAKFVRRMSKKQAKRWAPFMRRLKAFLNACGYKKLIYKLYGNSANSNPSAQTEAVIEKELNKQVLYIPFGFDYQYDTRCFRSFYQAKSKPLVEDVWTSMTCDEETYKSLRAVIKKNLSKEKPSKKKKSDEECSNDDEPMSF